MKIALCIIGGYKKDSFETIKKMFIEENAEHDLDIYISTWDVSTTYEYIQDDTFNLETDVLTFWDFGRSPDSHRRIKFEDKLKDLTYTDKEKISVMNCRDNMHKVHMSAPNRRWTSRLCPWHYRSTMNYLSLHKKAREQIQDKQYDLVIACRPDASRIPTGKSIKFIDERNFIYNGKHHTVKNNMLEDPFINQIFQGVKNLYNEPEDSDNFVCCNMREYGILDIEWMFGTQHAMENIFTLYDFFDHALDLMERYDIVTDTETAYILKYITGNIPVYILNIEDFDEKELATYIQKMQFICRNYRDYIKESAKKYISA